MVDANIRSHDERNYQIPGRLCLFFRKRGSTDQADWKSLGNLVDAALAPVIERLDHFSNYNGQRAKDRNLVSERSATLNVTIDEINRDNLQFAFGSDEGHSDSSVDTFHTVVKKNPGAGNDIQLPFTSLKVGSIIVRSIGLEPPETTFTPGAGNDYTVDEAAGTITILAGGALDGGDAEVHVFFEKTVDSQKWEIFSGEEIEGEAQFQLLTEGAAQNVWTFGNVSIRNNGDISFGDGTTYQQIPLTLEILVDEDGEIGTEHLIDDAAKL